MSFLAPFLRTGNIFEIIHCSGSICYSEIFLNKHATGLKSTGIPLQTPADTGKWTVSFWTVNKKKLSRLDTDDTDKVSDMNTLVDS